MALPVPQRESRRQGAEYIRSCGEHLIELYRAKLGKQRVDGVADLSRLCRLPGTVNHPGKKAKKGRTARLACVVEESTDLARRYGPGQFAPPEGFEKPKAKKRGRKAPKPSGVTQIDTLDDLPEAILGGRARMDYCKVVIAQGCDPDHPDRFGGSALKFGLAKGDDWVGDRSRAVYHVCCELVRAHCDDDTIRALLLDEGWGISSYLLWDKEGRDRKDPDGHAQRQIDNAREEVGDPEEVGLILDPGDPLPSARIYTARESPHLLFYNGDWLDYDGAAYAEVEPGVLKSRLFKFLAEAKRLEPKGKKWEEAPFKPTSTKVNEVRGALEALTIRPRDVYVPPCWTEDPGPPPTEIISCANGLLHLPTGKLMDPSPRFFTRNALDIGYDPAASAPTRWLRFLDDLWAHDPDSIDVLQEVMGYLLVPDTSQQKVFLLIGPARSGKGTIGRILRQLVGYSNVVGSTMKSLGGNFGLEPLIGKQLAIVADMRLSHRSDPALIAENLLRISGEDLVTADRKNKTAWTGTLAVRFVIMTNELPQFADASGALANRFVPLRMTESFLGREEPGLEQRLVPELPGILGWAIEGWRRLQDRGRFVLPGSARETIQALVDLASPVSAFVRDRCVLDPEASVGKDELYTEYQAWSCDQGQTPDIKDVFSRNLLAATRVLAKKGPRPERKPMFFGIRLVSTDDDETFG